MYLQMHNRVSSGVSMYFIAIFDRTVIDRVPILVPMLLLNLLLNCFYLYPYISSYSREF